MGIFEMTSDVSSRELSNKKQKPFNIISTPPKIDVKAGQVLINIDSLDISIGVYLLTSHGNTLSKVIKVE